MDYEFQPDSTHGLTMFGGTLAIISTIIGGGIVGLPFALLQLGLWIFLVALFFMTLSTVNSCSLYLRTKDLIPGRPESLYEIGYSLFKRSSIFIISAILLVNGIGIVILYFIVYGNIMVGLSNDFINKDT